MNDSYEDLLKDHEEYYYSLGFKEKDINTVITAQREISKPFVDAGIGPYNISFIVRYKGMTSEIIL